MPGRHLSLIWASEPALHAPAKYRRACSYEAFIPEPLAELPPALDAGSAGVLSEAEEAIRSLNASAWPALAPLARLLLRTESIASSKIEGMQLGVRELARAEARMESGGKPSPNAREILANIAAMELAIDEAVSADRFGVEHILAIHTRLMATSPTAHNAGRLRTQQNWIGGNDYNPCGADFVPPPPDQVPWLLDDLCAAINDDLLPPIMQAALVHAQFETIHPFDDGNGRTGRALIHVVLRRRGIAPAYVPPISVVLANARDRYIEGLTGFRGERVAAWVEQFAAAAAVSARLATAYLRAVGALTESWRERLRATGAPPRAGATAWAIIDILPAHPMITAPVATAVTGRTKAVVYDAIQELVAAGVLVPLSESRRNQAWEAVGLLDLLESLEAGTLPPTA
ncbi:MAG: Fic family protein [Gemmatimonadaceae bacterium]|nr:Fic family protein [Gemmatimonadaceae bacterium]